MNRIFILAIVASFIACEKNGKSKIESSYVSHIKGLASPIKLTPDTTRIRIKDFFSDIQKLDSIVWLNQRVSWDNEGQFYLLAPENSDLISNISFYYDGVKHDVPVFRTEKLKYELSYKTSTNPKEVAVAGSINGWNKNAGKMDRDGDVWKRTFTLDPGIYQYRIWEDNKELLDKNNPNTADNGMGGLNSTFQVGDPSIQPGILTLLDASTTSFSFLATKDIRNIAVYFQNTLVNFSRNGDTCSVDIPEYAKNFERSFIRVFSDNGKKRSNDLLIPLNRGLILQNAEQLSRNDMHGAVMYFMMVDRFYDGDSSNNFPTLDPAILPQANNLGGDLKGITEKIKSGYFRDLGINTIWVSPISQNAKGAWGLWDKGKKSKFSAYHGYWPTALTSIDNRFGTEESFKELIKVAHENNMNVILDYVAHHVHQEHPLVGTNPTWFTPLYLPDGTINMEKWDEHRLTTWFDTFLPTFDFSKPEVISAMTDSAMFWVTNYDLDGFRHDATKHIPNEFWQELTYKLKQESERPIYQIGETYGNPELIGSYIGSGLLDAQFDFNLYDAMVDAFAKDQSGFENLGRVLNQSLYTYGYHHLMGNITGNQDRARFTSYADGSVKFDEDPKLAGWTRKIENSGDVGYRKMGMLQAFLMTSPGIPCIYYGDEIAMPGANDPDNRRMMTFSGLNGNQSELKTLSSLLVKARNGSMALSYGDLQTLRCDQQNFIFLRNYFGKTALVFFSKDPNASTADVQIPSGINTKNLAAFNGSSFIIENGKLQITSKSENFKKYGFEIIMN